MQEKSLPVPLPRHIDHYLNMAKSELSLHSSVQLAEIQFEILSYAYYVQNLVNQQIAKADMCQFRIDKIIGPLLNNYSHIYGKDDKRLSAISDNTDAGKYRNIEVYARAAVTRMSYLTQRLESISKSIESITRRRQDG